jgi:hypothetical protein
VLVAQRRRPAMAWALRCERGSGSAGEDVTFRPVPSDVRGSDRRCHLVMSTTVPFAPDLLRDDTSLGTLSVVVVKAMTCGALVAMVTVVDRRVYVGIARSLHGSLVWAGTPPSGTVRDQCDDQRSSGGVMTGSSRSTRTARASFGSG